MSLTIEKKNTEIPTLALTGRLDTVTAPELEKEIMDIQENVTSLVIDMKNLEYVSSAGLRVILKIHKILSAKGGLKIVNVSKDIKEVFDITGFSDFLVFE